MRDLHGILCYIYLLQSSIEYVSYASPLRSDLVVYRGISQGGVNLSLLYESMINDVVFWAGFTSTSTLRDHVIDHFITDEDSLLFEITLHRGDSAVFMQEYSVFPNECEVLIAASSGFLVRSVDEITIKHTVVARGSDATEVYLQIPVVRLSYFVHWTDFNIDRCPPVVIV
jgi:hypothetical protein